MSQTTTKSSSASRTLVLQSHTNPLPYAFLTQCLASVQGWAEHAGYDYRYIGDELLQDVPTQILDKTAHAPVIATDLGRLLWLQKLLDEGWQRVVWLDADVLVFEPAALVLPPDTFAVGREHWVQLDGAKLRSFNKVHNAILVATAGDHFLPFYFDAALRLLTQNNGHIPPQFIGPKLLTALHNVVQLAVIETVNMLPDMVAGELIQRMTSGNSSAAAPGLDRLRRVWATPPAALNLCASSVRNGVVEESAMAELVSALSQSGAALLLEPGLNQNEIR